MSNQGNILRNNNEEIVKHLNQLREQREEISLLVEKQTKEKSIIEIEIQRLYYKLNLLNKSLLQRTKTLSMYNKTLDDIEVKYEGLVESAQGLLSNVRSTTTNLENTIDKKVGTEDIAPLTIPKPKRLPKLNETSSEVLPNTDKAPQPFIRASITEEKHQSLSQQSPEEVPVSLPQVISLDEPKKSIVEDSLDWTESTFESTELGTDLTESGNTPPHRETRLEAPHTNESLSILLGFDLTHSRAKLAASQSEEKQPQLQEDKRKETSALILPSFTVNSSSTYLSLPRSTAPPVIDENQLIKEYDEEIIDSSKENSQLAPMSECSSYSAVTEYSLYQPKHSNTTSNKLKDSKGHLKMSDNRKEHDSVAGLKTDYIQDQIAESKKRFTGRNT